ncbi:MAG: HlyD family secretion protein [Novosphingobium sp.]|nr:HlyD family secretion protein [Novosphingobium sp.]MCP5402861.1 HlyD family secretion protein [Novosphingobium sp.]
MAESDPQFDDAVTEAAMPAPRRGRWRRLAVMVSVPALLIAGATAYYFASLHTVSTDNAYVQQDKVSVSSQVTGEIIEVAVHENEHVKAGDLLFRIDPEPFSIAIAQADAAIAAAQVDIVGLETELGNTSVDIGGAREDVGFYEQEYRRQSELMQRGFTTRARLEQAEHDLSDARSRLATAEAEAREARAKLATAPVAPGVNPRILAAQAQRRKAALDLSRASVRAPVAGTVSQADRLQIGQMMTTGLPALTLVVSDRSWVEANFKETDLAEMRIGQPAKLTFDAYPGLSLKGHVASIGAGTGSEFSVLPAQNASGNWVKVTQRVPVRIAIDDKPSRQLIAGLSTHVSIDTSR